VFFNISKINLQQAYFQLVLVLFSMVHLKDARSDIQQNGIQLNSIQKS